METNSPCRVRKPSYHASNPLRNSADNKSSFMPKSNTNFDLSLYRDIVEIYREPMAPTCVYTALRPGTNEKVAIKKIFKDELVNDFLRTQAAEEFPLHCTLDHPYIVRGLEYAENSREHILVMEYMNDAEYLKNKIETSLNPIKNEQKMRNFSRDIFEAIAYLHSRNIVHGDIKFDNLLFNRFEGEKMRIVKLCDFGLSRYLDEKTGKFLMTIPVGSITYMAPEIKANTYVDEKIDIWAMGIVLYKMAVAYKPTQVNSYKYGSGPIPFRRVDWRKLSKELQDLIIKLLEYEPEKRISAKDALNHPWFQMEEQVADGVNVNTVA